MKTPLLKIAVLLFYVFTTTPSIGQNSLWQRIEDPKILENMANQDYKDGHYSVFSLDFQEFKRLLKDAPLRGTSQSQLSIQFANAQGKFENFKIFEAPIFSPSLSSKYPEIKSFVGFGELGSIIRFSLDPRGLEAMIKPVNGFVTSLITIRKLTLYIHLKLVQKG